MKLTINSIPYNVDEKQVRKFSKLIDLLYLCTPGNVALCLPCSSTIVEEILNFITTGDSIKFSPDKIMSYNILFQILQSPIGLTHLNEYVISLDNNSIDEFYENIYLYNPNIVKNTKLTHENFLKLYHNPTIDVNELLLLASNDVDTSNLIDFNEIVPLSRSLKFNNKYGDSKYFDNGEKIIPSNNLLSDMFQSFTEGMLNKLDFVNKNYAIAGGCISCILNPKIKFAKYSDIDIYVWGSSQEERVATINEVLSLLPEEKIIFQNNNIVNVFVRHYTRNIQIIDSGVDSLKSILSHFDNNVSQMAYTGTFVCTISALHALMYQVATFSVSDPLLSRHYKQHKRGFKIKYNNDIIPYITTDHTKEIIQQTKNKYLFITNEPIQRVKYLVRKIYGCHYIYVTDIIDNYSFTDWKRSYITESYNETHLNNYTVSNHKLNFNKHEKYLISTLTRHLISVNTGLCKVRMQYINWAKSLLKLKIRIFDKNVLDKLQHIVSLIYPEQSKYYELTVNNDIIVRYRGNKFLSSNDVSLDVYPIIFITNDFPKIYYCGTGLKYHSIPKRSISC